jgi:hypothetical protein
VQQLQQLDKIILGTALASQQIATSVEEIISQTNSLQGVASFFRLDQQSPSVLTVGAGN